MTASNEKRKIRYAVVGLGWISQVAVLPAFANAENSELVALVSDDPTKREELGKKYQVQKTYSYAEYDRCLESGEVDAVYIGLPNHLHREYTMRSAKAGVHVLCEKPMAVTEQDCEAMIAACQDNNVKLMIAYRLHFEPANMQAVEIVKSGQIGEPRFFSSVFAQQVEEANVRVKKDLGGGVLDDMGIYCINAARYLFQDEPIEVFAVSASKPESRFQEVAEMHSVILRFPEDRLATFTCSFGTAPVGSYQIVGTKGDLRLDPGYDFQGALTHYLTIEGKTQERTFPPTDQFAAELIYFADCILQNKNPEPSGIEGLNDIRIIRALDRAVETGRPVKLGKLEKQQHPSAAQIIERPPIQRPELIHAADPSGKS